VIASLDLNDIQLRSGKVIQKNSPIIEEQIEEETLDPLINKENQQTSTSIDQTQQNQQTQTPPFPKRLNLHKQILQPEFDLLDELKNVCIKIPLLQAIKDIPIYAKIVREVCIKKQGRKKKYPQTVQVIGKFADLMSGNFFMQKYSDPGSPIVQIHINNVVIANTLIDLGATINVMTKGIMDSLHVSNLCYTPIVLQLPDRSVIKPKGILEDVIVSIDSWE